MITDGAALRPDLGITGQSIIAGGVSEEGHVIMRPLGQVTILTDREEAESRRSERLTQPIEKEAKMIGIERPKLWNVILRIRERKKAVVVILKRLQDNPMSPDATTIEATGQTLTARECPVASDKGVSTFQKRTPTRNGLIRRDRTRRIRRDILRARGRRKPRRRRMLITSLQGRYLMDGR